MRRFRFRGQSLLLAALAVLVGVGGLVARGATAQAAETPRLTSKQIADAVLFSDGEAARYLTSLRRGQTPWSPELRKIQSDVHASLSADSYYVSAFPQAMQSGDPRAVNTALSRLGHTLRDTLVNRYGQTEVDKAVALFDKWWSDERTLKESIQSHEFDSYVGVIAVNSVVTAETEDTDQIVVLSEALNVNVGEEVAVVTDVVAVVAVVVAAVAVVAAVVVAVAGFGSDGMQFSPRTRMAQEVFLGGVARGLRFGR